MQKKNEEDEEERNGEEEEAEKERGKGVSRNPNSPHGLSKNALGSLLH